MKREKAALGGIGLKVFLLAVGLAGLPQSTFANALFEGAAPTGRIQAPPCLGGVSLARPQPWQPAATYRISMVPGSYGPAVAYHEDVASVAQGDVGVDPVQTAAIIPGVFGSVALSMRNFPVAARWAPVYQAIVG